MAYDSPDFSILGDLGNVYKKASNERTLADLGKGLADGTLDYKQAAGLAAQAGRPDLVFPLLHTADERAATEKYGPLLSSLGNAGAASSAPSAATSAQPADPSRAITSGPASPTLTRVAKMESTPTIMGDDEGVKLGIYDKPATPGGVPPDQVDLTVKPSSVAPTQQRVPVPQQPAQQPQPQPQRAAAPPQQPQPQPQQARPQPAPGAPAPAAAAAPAAASPGLGRILQAIADPNTPASMRSALTLVAQRMTPEDNKIVTTPNGDVIAVNPRTNAMTPIYKGGGKFGVIGEDQYGKKEYGYPPAPGAPPASGTADAPSAAARPPMPTGQAYLDSLNDPAKATLVKSIAEGRSPYPGGFLLKTPYGQWLTQAVGQYEPGVDVTLIQRRTTFNKQLGSSSPSSVGGQKALMGTSLGHLSEVAQAAADLGGSNGLFGLAAAGHAANAVSNLSTNQAAKVNKLNETVDRFSGEVGKLYSGSAGGGVQERDQTRSRFGGTQTPAELAAGLEASRDLIRSKLQALENQRDEIFGPDAKNKIDFLGNSGRQAIEKIDAAIAQLRGGTSAPAAAPNAAPARPPGVPDGSAFSPSRGLWRDPKGNMYGSDGTPAR